MKRWIALLLALVMALSLTACGKKKQPMQDTEPPAVTEDEENKTHPVTPEVNTDTDKDKGKDTDKGKAPDKGKETGKDEDKSASDKEKDSGKTTVNTTTDNKPSGTGTSTGTGSSGSGSSGSSGGSSGSSGGNSGSTTFERQYSSALSALQKGDYATAITCFSAAIRMNSMSTAAYVGLAECYAAQGDMSNAKVALQTGITAGADKTVLEDKADELNDYTEGEKPRTVSQFNENGKLAERTFYYDDGDKRVIEYNEKALAVKESYYNESGKLSWYLSSEYDAEGRDIKATFYNPDGIMTSYRLTEYAADGAFVRTNYMADGTINNVWECAKDGSFNVKQYEDGRVISISEYAVGGLVKKTSYYNADGGLERYSTADWGENGDLKETHYDAYGNILGYMLLETAADGSSTQTDYNADGIVTDIFKRAADDSLILTHFENGLKQTTQEFDPIGHEVKRTHYDTSGNISSYMVAEYAADGSYTQTHYTADSVVTNIYKFAADGSHTRTAYNADGTISSVYDFNTAGKPTREVHSDPTGVVTRLYAWEYDESGRLVKDIEHRLVDGAMRCYVMELHADGSRTSTESDLDSGRIYSITKYAPDGSYTTTYYKEDGTIDREETNSGSPVTG